MITSTTGRRPTNHETAEDLSSKKMYGMLAMRSLQNIKLLPDISGPPRKNLYTAWKDHQSYHDTTRDTDLDEDSQQLSIIRWNEKSSASDAQSTYQSSIEAALPIRASSITRLPNEILQQICEDSTLTEQDWYYLSYVRIFHETATELLYSEINVHEDSIFLVLRTLLKYPKHAAMVRVLDIERSSLYSSPGSADSIDLLVYARQNGVFVDAYKNWIGTFGFGWAVALLMLSTPNVQRLSIGNFMSGTRHPPGIVDLGMTLHIPSFQNLKRLLLRYPDRTLYVHNLAPFFKLPSLETLIVWLTDGGTARCKDTRDRGPSIFGPEQTSSINTIHLYNGDMHFNNLAAMLKSCKSLRALALDRCDLSSKEDGMIRITSFSETLESFRNTLRFLRLTNVLRPISSDQCVTLGSFTKFGSLESICVDLNGFRGPDPRQWTPVLSLLPGSVKEIHLNPGSIIDENPTSRLIFAPNGFLSKLCSNANFLPRLEYLTFSLNYHAIEDDDLQDIKEKLRRRGVEVKHWKHVRWEPNGPACDDYYGYRFADLD